MKALAVETVSRKPIVKLTSETIAQIAAGEVIERPSSVVKELIENSLDAGATQITVEIYDGGRSLIRVSDDGVGIEPDQIELALERHATSKLTHADELSSVRTLGFRGEGLSSIATVSRVTVTTRTEPHDVGVKFRCEGGMFVERSPIGCRVGCRVDVADLYFNTPARKKFLRSAATESAHITELVQRISCAYPEVHFTLRHDDYTILDVGRQTAREGRVRDIFSTRVRSSSLFHGSLRDQPDLICELFLMHPTVRSRTARHLFFVVNRRPIRDRGLLQAVQSASKIMDDGDGYLQGVVFLDIESDRVDVNVHPQKWEVRFSEFERVYELVRRAMFRWIESLPSIEERRQTLRPYRFQQSAREFDRTPQHDAPSKPYRFCEPTSGYESTQSPLMSSLRRDDAVKSVDSRPVSTVRFLSETGTGFWIFEVSPELYIVDKMRLIHYVRQRELAVKATHADDVMQNTIEDSRRLHYRADLIPPTAWIERLQALSETLDLLTAPVAGLGNSALQNRICLGIRIASDEPTETR